MTFHRNFKTVWELSALIDSSIKEKSPKFFDFFDSNSLSCVTNFVLLHETKKAFYVQDISIKKSSFNQFKTRKLFGETEIIDFEGWLKVCIETFQATISVFLSAFSDLLKYKIRITEGDSGIPPFRFVYCDFSQKFVQINMYEALKEQIDVNKLSEQNFDFDIKIEVTDFVRSAYEFI